jgi:hypothetical protein
LVVKDGKLVMDNVARFFAHVKSLEGKRCDLTIKIHREKRSDQQNRYDHCGYDREEMHEALKEKFLAGAPDENGLRKIASTARLDTDEFIKYTNKIVMWAAQVLGVYIPDPGQVDL